MRVAYLLVAATALVSGAGLVGAEQPKAQMTPQQSAETLVEQAQKKLAAMDLKPGPVNGIEHRETQEAVKKFQKAQKLDVSGRLDAKTLTALGVRPTITMARSAPANEQVSMIASVSESGSASPSESSSAAPSESSAAGQVQSEASSAAPSESTSPPSESKQESSSERMAEPTSEPPKS